MADPASRARDYCALIWSMLLGFPVLGIFLALKTGNPWWLWLIAPLMVLMEAGLLLIAVILVTVWTIIGA
jgi:hypothetical protein